MGAFLSSRIMTDIFGGLTNGVIYALVALSLVIIWQSTHVLNFAQGAMAMLATYIGLTRIDHGLGYFWCLAIAIAAGFLVGGLTERVLIRPLYGKPEINPIVVMVGFLGLIEASIQAIWTSSIRYAPAPFSQTYYSYHDKTILITPFLIFQIVLALAIMLSVALLFRYTRLGLQLRAAAAAPEVARLLGVRVSRMLNFGWVLASGVGAAAAVVVSSGGTGYTPTAMDGIFVSGFIAAAIGGLESPGGAVAGGIALGICTQFIQDFWSGNVAPIAPLMILIVVLMLRPQGLFTRHASRRV